MAEQPHDVVAYSYVMCPAYQHGSEPQWFDVGGGNAEPMTEASLIRHVARGARWDWWDYIAVRLRNGQIIRVRPRRRPSHEPA